MQRTYDGDLTMRMSISALTDVLNCVPAVAGRFLDSSSSRVKQAATMVLRELTMASLKSRKSRSLFLSMNPVTLYVTDPA